MTTFEMRRLLITTFLFTLLFSVNPSLSQIDTPLSKGVAIGLSELRADILSRKETYTNRINKIISNLDTSSLSQTIQKEILQFIRLDIKSGGSSNSLTLYDQIPKGSPFKNIYIEQYIANNQDYQIDKELIASLIQEGILTKESKINSSQMEVLMGDFQFLDIKDNDRILLHNANGGLYAMLLGYCHENFDLTIRHSNLFKHYQALDRIDRYPNINNGNLIEFLLGEGTALKVKDQKWDKIIIRNKYTLESSPGYLLNSLHDNLSEDGHLYILHRVKDEASKCPGYLDETMIIKRASRSKFELVDSHNMGCLTYYKFKSTKELK